MSDNTLNVKIGEAWKAYHAGQLDSALEQFNKILADASDNIDGYWGLGLCHRKLGNKSDAVEAFEKASSLIDAAIEAGTGEVERLVMLQRMVKQQIEQMDDFID